MCTTCFTSAEALALNSAGLAALTAGAVSQLRRRMTTKGADLRRRDEEATTALLQSLGLSPAEVLGTSPEPRRVGTQSMGDRSAVG